MSRKKQTEEPRCPFKPFELDTEVCDLCGKLHSDHIDAQASYMPYKEAIWKVLLEKGGIHSYYGGIDGHRTLKLRAHFGLPLNDYNYYQKSFIKELKAAAAETPCEIDWKQTREPRMDKLREFNGTFTDSELYVDAVVGILYCACGEYYMTDVMTQEMTVGQIIWHAVKAGEINGGDD